jgi:putative endonuclease
MKQYFVYIMASRSLRTYIGMTSNLEVRVFQHKTRAFEGHTARYNIDRLVFIEEFANVDDAIARERELKGWSRARKIALIEHDNPDWDDLSEYWFK